MNIEQLITENEGTIRCSEFASLRWKCSRTGVNVLLNEIPYRGIGRIKNLITLNLSCSGSGNRRTS
ncbi:MAG: hypothetical protein IPN86_04785 [Saprospiraceae bacterium]|nr:hypothetical protein [Saprospiraceae bacterium]